jgi:hypothetical protein
LLTTALTVASTKAEEIRPPDRYLSFSELRSE